MPRFSDEDLARIKERKRELDEHRPPKPLCDVPSAILYSLIILWLVGLLEPSMGKVSAALVEGIEDLFRALWKALPAVMFCGLVTATLWRPRATKNVWTVIGFVTFISVAAHLVEPSVGREAAVAAAMGLWIAIPLAMLFLVVLGWVAVRAYQELWGSRRHLRKGKTPPLGDPGNHQQQ